MRLRVPAKSGRDFFSDRPETLSPYDDWADANVPPRLISSAHMPDRSNTFGGRIRKAIAARAGFRCSLPSCRLAAPPDLGVLAHITAVHPQGPRYDPSLSPDERQAPENAIWVCQNCAKLIDSRPDVFSAEALRAWKAAAETSVFNDLDTAFLAYIGVAASPLVRRPLRVFLCHASCDKDRVRRLYRDLASAGYHPWFDEANLLPGQDWNREITRAIRGSDAVIVALSEASINKRGYVQKEIQMALDVADEQPEGAIFLIPVRFERCVVPDRLSRWQWVNLYEPGGSVQLMRALATRAATLLEM